MGTQSTWGEQNRQYNKHNIISQTNIFLKMSGSRVPVTMRDFFFDDPFFKNSWEDFDKVRDAMFTESRDMWKKFDDGFRNMACMSNNIMLESDSQQQQQEAISNNTESSSNRSLMRQDSKSRWENGWMFPRRWMLPALNTDFPNNMDIFKSKDNEVIRVKEDDTKMEVSLDTSQYRPDELKVMVSDGVLTVEGMEFLLSLHKRSNLLSNKQDHETSKCINTYVLLNLKTLNVYYTFTHFIFMP